MLGHEVQRGNTRGKRFGKGEGIEGRHREKETKKGNQKRRHPFPSTQEQSQAINQNKTGRVKIYTVEEEGRLED